MNKIHAFVSPHDIRSHVMRVVEGLATPDMIDALTREIWESAPHWINGQAVYRDDEFQAMLAAATKHAADASRRTQ